MFFISSPLFLPFHTGKKFLPWELLKNYSVCEHSGKFKQRKKTTFFFNEEEMHFLQRYRKTVKTLGQWHYIILISFPQCKMQIVEPYSFIKLLSFSELHLWTFPTERSSGLKWLCFSWKFVQAAWASNAHSSGSWPVAALGIRGTLIT